MTGAGIMTVPFSTSVSDSVTRATVLLTGPDMETRSFSFTPMAAQSSSFMRTWGSDASRS